MAFILSGLAGLITENTVWNRELYVLNDPVTVFPGMMLTIKGNSSENPVTVQFDPLTAIRIQSGATVVLDQVVFQPSEGADAQGIVFLNEDEAYLNATNWICEGMTSCVSRRCCGGNQVSIENSVFRDNPAAMTGYSGTVAPLRVSNSLFLRNGRALGSGDYEVAGCVFAFNDDAMRTSRSTVKDTIFMRNGKAMQDPNTGREYMENVVFYQNSLALSPNCCRNDMGGFKKVTFLDNIVAMETRAGQNTLLSEVNFINSTEYHVRHGSSDSLVFTNLYWGAANVTTEQIRTKIFDLYDDWNLGLVQVEPFATSIFRHDLFDGVLPWSPPRFFLGVPVLPDPTASHPPVSTTSPSSQMTVTPTPIGFTPGPTVTTFTPGPTVTTFTPGPTVTTSTLSTGITSTPGPTVTTFTPGPTGTTASTPTFVSTMSPTTGAECSANPICAAQVDEGEQSHLCCPTEQGWMLQCCGVQQSCSANTRCSSLATYGLTTGSCCPLENTHIYLDCCTTVPTNCLEGIQCAVLKTEDYAGTCRGGEESRTGVPTSAGTVP